ncbi:unnamed protein product [Leuciscus chuanchicus]
MIIDGLCEGWNVAWIKTWHLDLVWDTVSHTVGRLTVMIIRGNKLCKQPTLFITPSTSLPSLHHSFSLSWEQVERFLRDVGWHLWWRLIDIFTQEWKGTVGMGSVGVMVSCPHGPVRENVSQTETDRLWRLAEEAGRKVSGLVFTPHVLE